MDGDSSTLDIGLSDVVERNLRVSVKEKCRSLSEADTSTQSPNSLKGGIRKRNQVAYRVHRFRHFDKVKFLRIKGFIFGRHISGYFDVRSLSGKKLSPAIQAKKFTLL